MENQNNGVTETVGDMSDSFSDFSCSQWEEYREKKEPKKRKDTRKRKSRRKKAKTKAVAAEDTKPVEETKPVEVTDSEAAPVEATDVQTTVTNAEENTEDLKTASENLVLFCAAGDPAEISDSSTLLTKKLIAKVRHSILTYKNQLRRGIMGRDFPAIPDELADAYRNSLAQGQYENFITCNILEELIKGNPKIKGKVNYLYVKYYSEENYFTVSIIKHGRDKRGEKSFTYYRNDEIYGEFLSAIDHQHIPEKLFTIFENYFEVLLFNMTVILKIERFSATGVNFLPSFVLLQPTDTIIHFLLNEIKKFITGKSKVAECKAISQYHFQLSSLLKEVNTADTAEKKLPLKERLLESKIYSLVAGPLYLEADGSSTSKVTKLFRSYKTSTEPTSFSFERLSDSLAVDQTYEHMEIDDERNVKNATSPCIKGDQDFLHFDVKEPSFSIRNYRKELKSFLQNRRMHRGYCISKNPLWKVELMEVFIFGKSDKQKNLAIECNLSVFLKNGLFYAYRSLFKYRKCGLRDINDYLPDDIEYMFYIGSKEKLDEYIFAFVQILSEKFKRHVNIERYSQVDLIEKENKFYGLKDIFDLKGKYMASDSCEKKGVHVDDLKVVSDSSSESSSDSDGCEEEKLSELFKKSKISGENDDATSTENIFNFQPFDEEDLLNLKSPSANMSQPSDIEEFLSCFLHADDDDDEIYERNFPSFSKYTDPSSLSANTIKPFEGEEYLSHYIKITDNDDDIYEDTEVEKFPENDTITLESPVKSTQESETEESPVKSTQESETEESPVKSTQESETQEISFIYMTECDEEEIYPENDEIQYAEYIEQEIETSVQPSKVIEQSNVQEILDNDGIQYAEYIEQEIETSVQPSKVIEQSNVQEILDNDGIQYAEYIEQEIETSVQPSKVIEQSNVQEILDNDGNFLQQIQCVEYIFDETSVVCPSINIEQSVLVETSDSNEIEYISPFRQAYISPIEKSVIEETSDSNEIEYISPFRQTSVSSKSIQMSDIEEISGSSENVHTVSTSECVPKISSISNDDDANTDENKNYDKNVHTVSTSECVPKISSISNDDDANTDENKNYDNQEKEKLPETVTEKDVSLDEIFDSFDLTLYENKIFKDVTLTIPELSPDYLTKEMVSDLTFLKYVEKYGVPDLPEDHPYYEITDIGDLCRSFQRTSEQTVDNENIEQSEREETSDGNEIQHAGYISPLRDISASPKSIQQSDTEEISDSNELAECISEDDKEVITSPKSKQEGNVQDISDHSIMEHDGDEINLERSENAQTILTDEDISKISHKYSPISSASDDGNTHEKKNYEDQLRKLIRETAARQAELTGQFTPQFGMEDISYNFPAGPSGNEGGFEGNQFQDVPTMFYESVMNPSFQRMMYEDQSYVNQTGSVFHEFNAQPAFAYIYEPISNDAGSTPEGHYISQASSVLPYTDIVTSVPFVQNIQPPVIEDISDNNSMTDLGENEASLGKMQTVQISQYDPISSDDDNLHEKRNHGNLTGQDLPKTTEPVFLYDPISSDDDNTFENKSHGNRTSQEFPKSGVGPSVSFAQNTQQSGIEDISDNNSTVDPSEIKGGSGTMQMEHKELCEDPLIDETYVGEPIEILESRNTASGPFIYKESEIKSGSVTTIFEATEFQVEDRTLQVEVPYDNSKEEKIEAYPALQREYSYNAAEIEIRDVQAFKFKKGELEALKEHMNFMCDLFKPRSIRKGSTLPDF